MKDGKGKPKGRATLKPQNKRRQIATRVQTSQDRFDIVKDPTADWETWLSPEYQYIYVSPDCKIHTGYEPEAFMQDPTLMQKIIHLEDREMFVNHKTHIITTHTLSENLDFRILTREGKERWINHKCQSVFSSDGMFQGVRSSNRDITERKHQEENQNMYQAIFEATGTATLIVEEDTTIVMANNECITVTGYSPQELIGTKWPNYVASESLELMLKYHRLRREAPEKAPTKYEVKLVNKKGEICNVILFISMIKNTGKSVVSMLDITDRKRAEEALRESKDRYGAIVNNAYDGIVLQEASGKILTFNSEASRVFGINASDALQHTSTSRNWNTIHEDGSEFPGAEHPSMVTLATGKSCKDVVMGVVQASGETVWTNINTRPLFREKDSKPYAVVISFTDITEYKLAEKKIKESEAKLGSVVNNSTDQIFMLDKAYRYLLVNNTLAKSINRNIQDIIGRTIYEVYPEADAKRFERNVGRVFKNGKSISVEDQISAIDANLYFSSNMNPIKDEKGNVVAVSGILRDITHLKQTEDSLRQSKRDLQALLEAASVAMKHEDFLSTAREIFNICKRETGATAGYVALLDKRNSNNEVLFLDSGGRECAIDQSLPMPIRGLRAEAIKSGKAVYNNYFNKSKWKEFLPAGHVKLTNVMFAPLLVAGKTVGTIGLANKPGGFNNHDITFVSGMANTTALGLRNSQTLNLLKEEIDKAQNYLDIAGVIIVAINKEGKVELINKKGCQILGYDEQEILGKNWFDSFIPFRIKEELSIYSESLISAENNGLNYYENPVLTESGEERLIAWHSAVIKDKDGNITGHISSGEDITERKALEEEQKKLQRLESLGIFAGGIAHDFNNILTAIIGNISLVKKQTPVEGDQYEWLEEAEKASLRARDLTRQLLTFAKGGAPVKKLADLSPLIVDTTNFTLRGSNIKCKFRLAEDLWHVEIDEGQISQVINNLIINARQSMPSGGTIEVHGDNLYLIANKDIGRSIPLKNGNYVRIAIIDQGIGIPQTHFDKIFDPFFSTKQEGSGLGLATSYSIVHNHNGHIGVESTMGTGSTFYIYLPASVEMATTCETQDNQITLKKKARILVMDDEQTIRRVASGMLKQIGCEDIGLAANGEEAVKLYKEAMKAGRPFDIVILDLTIPGGMGGKETITKLCKIDPTVKALVSSGYSSELDIAEYNRFGFSGVIAKPYTIDQFCDALNKLAD